MKLLGRAQTSAQARFSLASRTTASPICVMGGLKKNSDIGPSGIKYCGGFFYV